MLCTKLNMADIWTESDEVRIITSWKYPMVYDVSDKHYLITTANSLITYNLIMYRVVD